MKSLYGMEKLGENVTNPFETLIRMICEVDMPPSLVQLSRIPVEFAAVHKKIQHMLHSVLVMFHVILNLAVILIFLTRCYIV